jgi:hypothetical protein
MRVAASRPLKSGAELHCSLQLTNADDEELVSAKLGRRDNCFSEHYP